MFYAQGFGSTGEEGMRRVGTRELKEHTKQVLERVQGGERILLTPRGNPVALLSPVKTEHSALVIEDVDYRGAAEQLEWLRASEPSFELWDNEDDVWDRIKVT
jgi:prevent-host-death family protein